METTTTEAPFALQLVVYIGVFSGIAWGLMVLFRDRSGPPPESSEEDERAE